MTILLDMLKTSEMWEENENKKSCGSYVYSP